MLKYTLIIPVYNKEQYIRDSIESVLSQKNGSPDEILVVDDHSSDCSMDIVRSLQDDRIRIICRKESGAGGYAARNVGIREARNEWISFLDADDQWLPDSMVRLLYEETVNPGISFFAQGWLRILNGTEEPDPHFSYYKEIGPQRISLEEYLRRSVKRFPAVHTNCVLLKKSLLLEAGLFPENERRGGDTDLWLRCLTICGELLYLPHLGARYFLSLPGAVTTSNAAIYGEHPVRKTIRKMLRAKDRNRKLDRLLKSYADLKTMDWMEEQKRRKAVNFRSFSYLFRPFSSRSMRMFASFFYHKVFKGGS